MPRKSNLVSLFFAASILLYVIYNAFNMRIEYNKNLQEHYSEIDFIRNQFNKIAKNKAIKNIISLDLYGTVEELIKDFALTDTVSVFKVVKNGEDIITWGRNSILFFESLRKDNSFKGKYLEILIDIDFEHQIVFYLDIVEMTANQPVIMYIGQKNELLYRFSLINFSFINRKDLLVSFILILSIFFVLYLATSKILFWQLDRRIKAQQLHDISNETSFLNRIASELSLVDNVDDLIPITKKIYDVKKFKDQVLGSHTVNFRYFDIKDCIDEVLHYIENFYFTDDIVVEVKKAKVFGDPNLLKRSIYNLIINAIRETSGLGSKVSISSSDYPNRTILSISNPGNLDTNYIKRGKSNYNSTGEGLSIAFEYAKKANGVLSFKNKNGSVIFTIELKK